MTTILLNAVSELFNGYNIFSMGIILAFVFITLALSRSLTKDDTYWAIGTGAIAFILMLIFPGLYMSGLMLLIGVFATTLAFFNLISDKNQNGSANAMIIAVIFIILNITLSATLNYYDNIELVNTNPRQASEVFLQNLNVSSIKFTSIFGHTSANGVGYCEPNEIGSDNTSCVSPTISGTFVSNAFVPLATVFNIVAFGGKGSTLISASVIGLNYYNLIKNTGIFTEVPIVITILFSIYILLLQLVVLIKGIQYFTNRWGG